MELQLELKNNHKIKATVALPPSEEETIRQVGKQLIQEISDYGEISHQKCLPKSWSKIQFVMDLSEKTSEKVSWLMDKLKSFESPFYASSREKTEKAKSYLETLAQKFTESQEVETLENTEGTPDLMNWGNSNNENQTLVVTTTKELIKLKKDELQAKCNSLGITYKAKHTKMELAEAIALGTPLS